MMQLRKDGVALGLIAALGWSVIGCGVPLQDSAQPLPSEVVAVPSFAPSPTGTATPTAEPTQTGTSSPAPLVLVERVSTYFVRDDGLVEVETEIPVPVFPESVVDALVAGPPAASGLRSVAVDPLTGTALIAIDDAGVEEFFDASVTVILAAQFTALPPTEQVLLLGQVVLSLSSAGWPTVAFVDSLDAVVAVPLPDGRLLDRPAVENDYASLIG